MSQNREALTQAILIGAIVIFIYASLNFISLRLRNKLVRQIMSRYKNKVFKSILDRDYREFSKEKSGKFISILTENMKKIEQDYLHQYFNISKNISLMIFSLVAMFIGNWFLTLLVIIASIIPMMISGFIGQKSASLQNSSMIADQKYLAKVKDILAGFLVIKSFNVKEAIGQDYKNESEKLDEIYFIKGKFDVLSNVISQLSGMIVFLVAFGGGMYLVFGGHTTIGSVTAIVQLVNFVVMPLNEIGMGMSKFREGQATLDAFEVKDVTELQTGETKEYFDDVISFSNIDFSYPNTKEKIFNHLSLKIQKGEKIAIVGPSGAGKSTLANLIQQMITPTKGRIIFNSEVTDIGMLNQRPYIFSASVKDNITMFNEVSDEKILQTLETVGLKEKILSLNKGIHTVIGEGGEMLSGGQMRRIELCRVLLLRPSILIFDEPTTGLDIETERVVQQTLEHNFKHATTITIAHRNSTIRRATRRLYVKEGHLIKDDNRISTQLNKVVNKDETTY